MAESRGLSVGIVVEAWTLGLMSLALSVAFLTFNIRMRKARVVKMSSPKLNVIIALGGIMISVTCVLFGLDYFLSENHSAVSRVCQVRVCLLVLSSSLVFGPMLAKAWRVNRIFKQAAIKRVVIRDRRLLMMTGCLLLVDIIIISVWQAIDPIRYNTVLLFIKPITDLNFDVSGADIVRVRSCSSANSDVWAAGIFTYKIILLLYGLYLSWQTRNVMLPSMNDARSIIVSVLVTVVMATFATSVGMMMRSWPNAVYACVIFSIWLCNMTAMCTVFIPKILLWWKNPDNVNFRVCLKPDMKLANGLQSLDQIEEELYHVVTENLTLKTSLQEKDKVIKELQQHLNNAKDKLMQLDDEHVKQDSGLDIDISSSSGQDYDPALQVADDPNADISSIHGDCFYNMYHHPSPDVFYKKQARRGSASNSVASLSKLCRLKDAIAEDLTQANILTNNLRNSLSKDLDQVGRRQSWMYDSVRSRQELAGSIARSYNLEDDGDTYSYVSSYLPSSSSAAAGFNSEPSPGGRRKRHAAHYGSAESLATLANDRMYPSITEQRRDARRKIRRGSWGRGDKPKKVYTIQNSPHPDCVMSHLSPDAYHRPGIDTFV